MREILFRGKRIDNGEWVYGHFAKHPSPIQIGSDYSPWYIFVPPRDPDDDGGWYNVDPGTVGQYTGLTDYNGRKIFEGDIIKQEYSLRKEERAIISVIEYGISYSNIPSYSCGVRQRFRDGSGTSMLSVFNDNGTVICEVIGNIHDNPKLLERGAE